MELATVTNTNIATAPAKATETRIIEIKYLNNSPRLFAPAVRPGATIVFHNDLEEGEINVTFNHKSPFQGDTHFHCHQQHKVYKNVFPNAEPGTYPFEVTTTNLSAKPRLYWLTVKTEGIDKVGFSFKTSLSGLEPDFDAHIQQWASRGLLEINFENSTDEEVYLTISDYPGNPVIVSRENNHTTSPFQFQHNKTIQLESNLQHRLNTDESGGTHVADILIEDP